jgi:hypothetical protein
MSAVPMSAASIMLASIAELPCVVEWQ